MIKQNIIWNFLGGTLPLVVGVFLFPLIIEAYGIERFGVLAIAWSVVGYFGLFDMGLSRALTQIVSNKLSSNTPHTEIVNIIQSTLTVTWFLGLFGGGVLWFISDWLVIDILSISKPIQAETILAFKVLAFSIPFVVIASMLRGVMEALHLFKQASQIRMFLGAFTFLGPFVATFFGVSLVYAVISLVIIRIVAWLMHAYAVNKTELMYVKQNVKKWVIDYQLLEPLFKFGGWMTISNIVGPLMVYFDRFLIAYMLGASAVAYYVVPYEMLTKLWIIPAAITGVLFPIFSKSIQNNENYASEILHKAIIYVSIILFPLVFTLTAFAKEGLGFWLSADFANKSATIVGWIGAGIIVNSIGQMLYAKIQGLGRPDLTAKLHILEAIPYWAILFLLIKQFGIQGAAIAWFLRVLVDTTALSFILAYLTKHTMQKLNAVLGFMLILTLPILSVIYIDNLNYRAMIYTTVIALFAYYSINKTIQDGTYIYLKKLIIK